MKINFLGTATVVFGTAVGNTETADLVSAEITETTETKKKTSIRIFIQPIGGEILSFASSCVLTAN